MRAIATFSLIGALALSTGQVSAQTSTGPAIPAATARPPVGQGENGDWAFIGRYREANQPLLAAADPKRVVFMGDSITQGWAEQPFVKGNAHFVGRGISGQTTPQMLVRFRSDVVALKPAVVHIMGGTNDVAQNTGPTTPEETEGYITGMVEIARANGIKVVLASIPPALDFPWRKDLSPGPKIKALNAWLKDYAARKHLVYVDYWPAIATPEGGMKSGYSHDGVHPNAEAFAAMAPLAQAAIDKAIRGK
ncbi:MAG: SGNH/GDSL hydrolase family protein [Pseudomonadota bacterium]|jgi:lysophospholipase L1-like esterase|uniref:Lipolytic enzyme, G-D-S-L n=1 Tax=hydrothermal vent metagenome TaxID=652676 RepID=A0A160TLN0_9ZZZZ